MRGDGRGRVNMRTLLRSNRSGHSQQKAYCAKDMLKEPASTLDHSSLAIGATDGAGHLPIPIGGQRQHDHSATLPDGMRKSKTDVMRIPFHLGSPSIALRNTDSTTYVKRKCRATFTGTG